MSTIDPQLLRQQVNLLAEQYGIDLQSYGNASPTKLIVESTILASTLLQQATKVAITERNPATAMEFRSMLGLAAITGLNPATKLQASLGKIKVAIEGHSSGTIVQHAKLSLNNIAYYVVLPAEAVSVKDGDVLIAKQGIIKTQTFTATGEHLETFTLQANNFVDFDSIEVTVDDVRLTVGKQIEDDCQCTATLDYNGKPIVMIAKSFLLGAGKSVVISYADCIGIAGDNLQAGQEMSVSTFIYNGDTDITADCKVTIEEPFIGGTDFDTFYKDLQADILLGGKNNLIGSEYQLLQYLAKYKHYTIQQSSMINGVLTLYCLHNLEYMVKTQSYWDACTNLDLTQDDINALTYHVNELDCKSTDMLVSIEHATYETCRVNVNIAGSAQLTDIVATVEQYLADNFSDRCYEVGDLYKRLMQIDNVQQVYITFDGNTNSYGSAVPVNSTAILVCTSARIKLNGELHEYGSYTPDVKSTIADEIKVLTETQIADDNIS